MLRTSANVNPDLLAKLTELSAETSIDTRELITKLLLFAANKIESNGGFRTLVQYQERTGVNRDIVNYYLSEDEYEQLSEIRHKYKVSISLLLYVAFLLFWDVFVGSLLLIFKKIGNNFKNKIKSQNSYAALHTYLSKNIDKCVKKLGFRRT